MADFIKIKKILDNWKDYLLNELDIDIYNYPECWCCHKPMIHNNEFIITTDNYHKIWSNTRLEICHIIPKSISNNNNPNNLFLMCGKCHKESPDSTNKELFLKWIKVHKNFIDISIDEILSSLNLVNFTTDDMKLCNNILENNSLKKMFMEYLQNNSSIHAGILKINTIIFTLNSFVKDNKNIIIDYTQNI